MHALLSERSYNDSGDFWGRCNSILIRYIGCDILDGLIVGAANFIFMLITGMPYNLLLSVVVGVTNLAPTFGPILGGVIGAFVLVLVNPWYALWFIIFTIILQTMDGYVIKPKLFGDSLGVSAVWILVSIIVGGRMFGVWGIMLAIPFAAIFDYVYRDMILKRLNKKNIKPEEPQEKSFLKAKTTAAKNNEKKDGVKK
jgi:predicted PurR-regulated permease PerM